MAYYNNYYPTYPYYQSYSNQNNGMVWVEGEVGAKAYQQPVGWPANTPIALWDSTDKKVFLKSWNAVGMANPLQELDYTIKDNGQIPAISGAANNYVTREDFDELKKEIQKLSKQFE